MNLFFCDLRLWNFFNSLFTSVVSLGNIKKFYQVFLRFMLFSSSRSTSLSTPRLIVKLNFFWFFLVSKTVLIKKIDRKNTYFSYFKHIKIGIFHMYLFKRVFLTFSTNKCAKSLLKTHALIESSYIFLARYFFLKYKSKENLLQKILSWKIFVVIYW